MRYHRTLYADVSDHFQPTLRVPKRPICAGGLAAISVYSDRVSHARGIARPIREYCDADKSGASFPQALPVIIKL